MDIALWIQTISTIVIAFFAYRMWGNAEANLKNATAMKELEETNLKIAMWPEIKKIILAIDDFTSNVTKGSFQNSTQTLKDFIKKLRFAQYYFRSDDELVTRFKKLYEIGIDIHLKNSDLIFAADPNDKEAGEVEIIELRKSILEESKEIEKVMSNRFHLDTTKNT